MSAPTKELLSRFDQLHKNRFNAPAVIVAGKDAKILAQLYKTHGQYLEPLMERFFDERNGFAETAGYTVGVFASQFAKLLKAHLQTTKRDEYWKHMDDWREECLRLHGGECENWRHHDLRMAKEELRARGEL